MTTSVECTLILLMSLCKRLADIFSVFGSEDTFLKIIVLTLKTQCLKMDNGTKHLSKFGIMESIVKLRFHIFFRETISVTFMKLFNDI